MNIAIQFVAGIHGALLKSTFTYEIPENVSEIEREAMIITNVGLKTLERGFKADKIAVAHKIKAFANFLRDLRNSTKEKMVNAKTEINLLGLDAADMKAFDFNKLSTL